MMRTSIAKVSISGDLKVTLAARRRQGFSRRVEGMPEPPPSPPAPLVLICSSVSPSSLGGSDRAAANLKG